MNQKLIINFNKTEQDDFEIESSVDYLDSLHKIDELESKENDLSCKERQLLKVLKKKISEYENNTFSNLTSLEE